VLATVVSPADELFVNKCVYEPAPAGEPDSGRTRRQVVQFGMSGAAGVASSTRGDIGCAPVLRQRYPGRVQVAPYGQVRLSATAVRYGIQISSRGISVCHRCVAARTGSQGAATRMRYAHSSGRFRMRPSGVMCWTGRCTAIVWSCEGRSLQMDNHFEYLCCNPHLDERKNAPTGAFDGRALVSGIGQSRNHPTSIDRSCPSRRDTPRRIRNAGKT